MSEQETAKQNKNIEAAEGQPFALKNWHWEEDENKVVWLGIDVAGEKNNIINNETIDELIKLVEYFYEKTPTAVVFYSHKSNGFIAGADINFFSKIDDITTAIDYVSKVQVLFQQIENLPCVTVAMIDGFCLGGGCELALACRYRVASKALHTKIGLPEVQLGIIPGWGGTVRLPRLIGVRRAIPLLLSGKLLPSAKAVRIGLIDVTVAVEQLRAAATYYALSANYSSKKRHSLRRNKVSLIDRLLSLWPCRSLLANIMRRQLSAKISIKHYPAPYTIIDNWQKNGAKGQRAFALEAATISRLVLSKCSRNLVRVFFLQQKLKSLASKQNLFAKPATQLHVHVIGAGVMGGDIAAWCALSGFRVTLQDTSYEKIQPALKRARDLFIKRTRLPYLQQRIIDRMQADPDGHGIFSADIIIEAIFEDVQAKQELFINVEKQCRADALLATNTSSLQLKQISDALQLPQRLVGIHFFNPVAKLPLVEVVYDNISDQESVQRAICFVGMIKKLPLPVLSSPGFLVNRTLMPYLLEAVLLLQEGFSPLLIDAAAKKFGMSMGPICLADSVGLDICLSVLENLSPVLDSSVPEVLQKLVAAGDLGVKTKAGFYLYKTKSQKKARTPILSPKIKSLIKKRTLVAEQDISDRLLYQLLNACVACRRQEIVQTDDYLDAGMIFGCSFPPFTGGPLNLIQDMGVAQCKSRMQQLQDRYGYRFTADSGWDEL